MDFEARVPIPVSFFPSAYKNDAAITETETHEKAEINLPAGGVGRTDQYSSYTQNIPAREERREEVHREEVHFESRRPNEQRREEFYAREEHKPDHRHAEAKLEINTPHHRREYEVDVGLPHLHRPHIREKIREHLPHFHREKVDIEVERPSRHHTETKFEFVREPHRRHYDTEIDITERQYRSKFQPTYKEEVAREEVRVNESTVDPPRPFRPTYKEKVQFTEETVEPSSFKTEKMGYYDEEAPRKSSSAESISVNTVTVPCHHIRLGDLLILQGRPCQVIKISTSNSTGQHRYLGVDLFTKQLHEESAFISNPSPSVVVQTMLGPVFKQYRVLDLQDGTVVAMTETGDVKQALPVIDQSNLWTRLSEAFETGRGSVRVLVISDKGRELVVDMKTLHGSRL